MRTAVLVLMQFVFAAGLFAEYRREESRLFLALAIIAAAGGVLFLIFGAGEPTKPACPGYQRWSTLTDDPCD